jgi:hypothetical protein
MKVDENGWEGMRWAKKDKRPMNLGAVETDATDDTEED